MTDSRKKISVKKTSSSLLNSLTDKLPLQPGKAVNLALNPYIALDCFARGKGNNFLYGTLVQYTVVVELLCQKGYLPERVPVVEEAQKQLINVSSRGTRLGEWRVEAVEYEALCDLLTTYSEQLELVNPKDLMLAHTGMMEMLLEKLAGGVKSTEFASA